jgi:hypothetical protein
MMYPEYHSSDPFYPLSYADYSVLPLQSQVNYYDASVTTKSIEAEVSESEREVDLVSSRFRQLVYYIT